MSRRHPYTPKEKAYVREQRRLYRARFREQIGLPVAEIAAETERQANARAYRSAQQLEEMTLRRWLALYGHVLWGPPVELHAAPPTAPPAPPDEVIVLTATDYSWLSGSCS